ARTLPLTTLVYPTKYAFWSAALSPAPYVVLTHRCLLVQFLQRGEVKTLLFNPTDVDAAHATPYFRRLIELTGERVALGLLTKRFDPLEAQLAALGLGPGDVDYVAFDHFHTQDLRPLLGTRDGARAPRFPRAKLLAPRPEWETWDDLHPMQRAWFVADGKRGVLTERVVLTEGDVELGDGAWLVRTPGHTAGNQTLFVRAESGVWGSSENGTSADSYSPHDSRIAGLARVCREQDLDVIANANTFEGGAEQYASMVLERALCDRVKAAPQFVQMLPSSEVTPSALAPGLRPSMVFGGLASGAVVRPRPAGSASAAPAAPDGPPRAAPPAA
ncbi:MAG TPA: hypothetical protein VFS00_21470, partial [Polyangiaceae bacterium]|nr:hypothetical protein [Polyangiaceae bacterium]